MHTAPVINSYCSTVHYDHLRNTTAIEYFLHRKILQYAIVLCCIVVAITSDTPSPLITLPYSRILFVAHFHAASFNPIFSSTLSPYALNELKINRIHLQFQQILRILKGQCHEYGIMS
jgi:hypothetical protein